MNASTLPGSKKKSAGYCIRYLRVSTGRQTHTDADVVEDGNSIDTQRKVCVANEKRLGLICVAEYIEPGASAQSIKKRKEFRKVLKRLNEERDAQFLSIYMRSRAFRDYIEAGQTERDLLSIGVKMVSAKEDYGDGLNGEFMKAITDVMNWYEARRNGVDIKEKMANKVKNGGTPSLAKLGYKNVTIEVDFRRINTIQIDQERMPYVLQAFELFATGQHTLETLQETLTNMGLRTRPTKRFPQGNPISVEHVRRMLRNRYYIGWVNLEGVEYKGRHETFISEELFERVQRVLDAHSGAGVRERKHPHYLKGWLWCNRCGQRWILQRTLGKRGGEYYYFFCSGKQDHTCEHPYVPIEDVEDAVAKFYQDEVRVSPEFIAEVRAMIKEADMENATLASDIQESFAKRLAELDKRENYFLDLAADEDWSKEKLGEKIKGIRAERAEIQRNLEASGNQLVSCA